MSTWRLSWQEIWLLIQEEPGEEEDTLRTILEGHELPEDFEPHSDLFAALYQEAVRAPRRRSRKTSALRESPSTTIPLQVYSKESSTPTSSLN